MITAVSACPRPVPGDEYLRRTVESLFVAGARDVYYYDDVCKLGSGLAVNELIRELYRRFPGEDVLLLEDDVIACANAVHAVERLTWPAHCYVMNCYVDKSANINFRDAQIRLMPARDGFVYAQAVKLRSDLIRMIATTDFVPDWAGDFWYFREATLWHWFRKAGGFIGYLSASWFEHIGDVSSLFGERKYKPRAFNWRGQEHDALSDKLTTVIYT